MYNYDNPNYQRKMWGNVKLGAIVAAVLYLLLALTGNAQDKAFRNVEWGDSRAVVIASEKGKVPIENKPTRVRYEKIKLDDRLYSLIYEFQNNKLSSAEYYYGGKKEKYGDAITAYFDFQEVLKAKYGEPLSDYDIDELIKKAPAHSAMLSIMSQLPIFKIWERPLCFITLVFYESDDDTINSAIVTYYYKLADGLPKSKSMSTRDF